MAGSALRNADACAAVMISGGASRIASGWTALTRKPARRAAASTSVAAFSVRIAASHRPWPRTPASSGWDTAAMPSDSCWPTEVAAPSSPSVSMTSSTARAAAQETGFAPNVEP